MISDIDLTTDIGLGDDAGQRAHLRDLLLVELEDHVAGLDARILRRPGGCDAGDQGAAGLLEAEAFGNIRRHRLDAHAEPAPAGCGQRIT